MWHVWDMRGTYGVLVGRPEGRTTIGRPWHRWEDNIKVDIQEVRCGGHVLDLSQDIWALVEAVL
jgi:hypothetical protein